MAKKKIVTRQKHQTNFNDVLIKLIDAVYNLVNSGNIVGVILLYFCVQVFYITQKLSAESLDKYLGHFFAIDFFYLFPLVGLLIISVVTNVIQARVYRRHINSLVETRKELIHGLQSGEMKRLNRHTTSGIDTMEPNDDC